MPPRPEGVPTADEVLVLAQSLAMDGSLPRFEALSVAEALRYLSSLISQGDA